MFCVLSFNVSYLIVAGKTWWGPNVVNIFVWTYLGYELKCSCIAFFYLLGWQQQTWTGALSNEHTHTYIQHTLFAFMEFYILHFGIKPSIQKLHGCIAFFLGGQSGSNSRTWKIKSVTFMFLPKVSNSTIPYPITTTTSAIGHVEFIWIKQIQLKDDILQRLIRFIPIDQIWLET